jgi:hypothetical protein
MQRIERCPVLALGLPLSVKPDVTSTERERSPTTPGSKATCVRRGLAGAHALGRSLHWSQSVQGKDAGHCEVAGTTALRFAAWMSELNPGGVAAGSYLTTATPFSNATWR